LPSLFVTQLVLEGGHGQSPAGNLPEEFAIGSAAHRRRVGKIAGRHGEFGSLFAFAVAFLSVTIPTVLAVRQFPRGDGVARRRDWVFQFPNGLPGAPIPIPVDCRQHDCGQHHNRGQYSEKTRCSFGLAGLHELFR